MVRLEDEREIAKRFDSVSNLKIRYSIIDEVRSSPGGILGKTWVFAIRFEMSWKTPGIWLCITITKPDPKSALICG